jgi:hypothetical protein
MIVSFILFLSISEQFCPLPDVADLLRRITLRADVAGRETLPFKRQQQLDAERRGTCSVAVRTGRVSGVREGVAIELKSISVVCADVSVFEMSPEIFIWRRNTCYKLIFLAGRNV